MHRLNIEAEDGSISVFQAAQDEGINTKGLCTVSEGWFPEVAIWPFCFESSGRIQSSGQSGCTLGKAVFNLDGLVCRQKSGTPLPKKKGEGIWGDSQSLRYIIILQLCKKAKREKKGKKQTSGRGYVIGRKDTQFVLLFMFAVFKIPSLAVPPKGVSLSWPLLFTLSSPSLAPVFWVTFSKYPNPLCLLPSLQFCLF